MGKDGGLCQQMELDKSTLSVVFCEVHKTIKTKQIQYGKVFALKWKPKIPIIGIGVDIV